VEITRRVSVVASPFGIPNRVHEAAGEKIRVRLRRGDDEVQKEYDLEKSSALS